MGQNKGSGAAGCDALGGAAAVVGSEGVLPVPLCVPVGKLVVHLGFRWPEPFFLRHQQQTHPAAQFALGLGVEPGSEFFHRLALHL